MSSWVVKVKRNRLQYLLLLTAVAYLALGGAFALWPHWTLSKFGVPLLPQFRPLDSRDVALWPLKALAQLYGLALMGTGLVAWSVRHVFEPAAQRQVVNGFLAANVWACGLTFLLQQAVLSRFGPLGWALSALFGSLTVAFAYFRLSPQGVAPLGTDPGPGRTLGELKESWLREVREAAAQQERSRLARDLHDSIKQQIFSINVSTAAAQARFDSDPAGARSALDDVRRSAHEAMAEMEAMLQHLRPAPLATVGLAEALRKQCEALQYRTGAAVQTDFGTLPGDSRLPPGTHETLFRIAQEVLANVARHARAKRVNVRLGLSVETSAEALELEITDDGQGFEPSRAPTGMGLTNVRNRSELIGARFALDSASGRGTRVLVSVPLIASDEEPAVDGRITFIAILSTILMLAANMDESPWALYALGVLSLTWLFRVARPSPAGRATDRPPRARSWRWAHGAAAVVSGTAFVSAPWPILFEAGRPLVRAAYLLIWLAEAGLCAFAFIRLHRSLLRLRRESTGDLRPELNALRKRFVRLSLVAVGAVAVLATGDFYIHIGRTSPGDPPAIRPYATAAPPAVLVYQLACFAYLAAWRLAVRRA
jgi:signal transduction histidine kinase